ncbi:MAG: hypothetical protein A3J29_01015 [Acidobacteria bacterium RIFCSPLOWO2_12_FULL_67_14b]|nr:MAG: hypothetical protein A3J29_01015 [Acidobacteria bacterium RIFCSPLOWO2_12_FULL_67_14b]
MIVRVLLLFALFWVIARVFWRFIEGVVSGATTAGAPGGRGRGGMQAGVKMTPCPVCGTFVVPGKAISQAGVSGPVYFCSDKCRAEYVPR